MTSMPVACFHFAHVGHAFFNIFLHVVKAFFNIVVFNFTDLANGTFHSISSNIAQHLVYFFLCAGNFVSKSNFVFGFCQCSKTFVSSRHAMFFFNRVLFAAHCDFFAWLYTVGLGFGNCSTERIAFFNTAAFEFILDLFG